MEQISRPVNFRDLGGIIGKDGKVVQGKRLLRCGEVSNLSEAEKKRLLYDHALRSVVDFREQEELDKAPDDILPGVVYHHIDIMEFSHELAPDREKLTETKSSQGMQDYMCLLYRFFITNEQARKGYRRFIDVLLAQQEGAVLFHCFAGKDRTGVGAAIILTLLGASKEDIVADYMITNKMRKLANEEILQQAREEGANQEMLEGIAIAMNVQLEFLDESYRVATEEYGSFENYILEGIGVSQQEVKQLQEMYLV